MPVTTEHPALGHRGHRLPKQACFPINSPPPHALAQHLANDSFRAPARIPDQHPLSVIRSLCGQGNQEGEKPSCSSTTTREMSQERDSLPRKLVGRCAGQSSGDCGLTPRRGQDTWHILPALHQDVGVATGPYLGLEASTNRTCRYYVFWRYKRKPAEWTVVRGSHT